MNATLLKSLVALLPTGLLFAGAVILFRRQRSAHNVIQVVGAGCLVIVVLTHVSEALRWFPWMQWGQPHSAGHYLDLSTAVLGFTLFPVGYLLHALTKR